MLRMRRLQLSALAACLVVALLAGGAAAPRARAAGERAAALQFGYAAYRARLAIKAVAPEIRARVGTVNSPACFRTVIHAPKQALERAAVIYALGYFHAVIDPALPAMQTFSRELDAIQTDDPVLRSGRSAWRDELSLAERLPAVGDACGQLAAWRRAGFAPSAAPPVDPKALKMLDAGDGLDRKVARAARRMRELGVPKSAAHRFGGDPLFRGVIPHDPIFNPRPRR